MGWRDMSCAGSTFYETPHIDALATNGVRFLNGYSSSPVCAPSRGAIFSGKNPAHTRFTTVFRASREGSEKDDRLYKISKKRTGNSKYNKTYEALHTHNLRSTEILFPQTLSDAGYATGFFGKWHCGITGNYVPDRRGFDVSIGYRNKHVGTAKSRHFGRTFKQYAVGMEGLGSDEYVADALTDHCIDFIRSNKEKPFLAVLSHYLVHDPIEPKPEYVERYNKKTKKDQRNAGYAAMVQSVDESVGRVVATLQDLGISENTLVVFTSDNGGLAPNQTSNYPLLGGKSFCFEAGVRVPLIISWPAVVKPGRITTERAIGMDFYPTFLEVAGIKAPAAQKLDGISLLPILEDSAPLRERPLIFHFPHYTSSTSPYSSIIYGKWKLIQFYNDEKGGYLLFDIVNDEIEQNDLSKTHPEVVQALATKLRQELDRMGALYPTLNPRFDPSREGGMNRETVYQNANKHRAKFKAMIERPQ